MFTLSVLFLIVSHIILTCAVVSDIKNYNNWLPVPAYLGLSSIFIVIYIELFKLFF